MSYCAFHQPEALAGLLFEQPLNFELRFGGAGQSYSHMEHRLVLRLSSLEGRLDQHECRAAQNSVDQKEIVESVRMNGWNSPPLLNSHSNVLPALLGAKTAREEVEHNLCYASSKFLSHPAYYGLFHFGNNTTGGRA